MIQKKMYPFVYDKLMNAIRNTIVDIFHNTDRNGYYIDDLSGILAKNITVLMDRYRNTETNINDVMMMQMCANRYSKNTGQIFQNVYITKFFGLRIIEEFKNTTIEYLIANNKPWDKKELKKQFHKLKEFYDDIIERYQKDAIGFDEAWKIFHAQLPKDDTVESVDI